jgi:hypothetical protein
MKEIALAYYYVTVAGQKKAGIALKADYEIRGSELKREPDEIHARFSVDPEDCSDRV